LIQFHLDQKSGIPFYVQLVQQVRRALLFGVLKAGDRLPTVKEVVAQVAINPNTVLRAYRDLEHDGVVISRPGLGTFVSATPPASNTSARGLSFWPASFPQSLSAVSASPGTG